jgi:hypothetical protein
MKVGDKVKVIDVGSASDSTLGKLGVISSKDGDNYGVKVDGTSWYYRGSRIELLTPEHKFGDPCWVEGRKYTFIGNWEDQMGYYYVDEGMADRGISGSRLKYRWKDEFSFTDPVPEPEIELFIDGHSIPLSKETLESIREATK